MVQAVQDREGLSCAHASWTEGDALREVPALLEERHLRMLLAKRTV